MVARIFVVVFFFFFATTTLGKVPKLNFTGKEKTELISTRETKNCFVSLVKIGNKIYLVKQKKDPKKQLAVIRDALSSYIARDLEIAQQVIIIPFKIMFLGKIESQWPATIHSLAPGKTVREQRENKFSALRLRQFWAHVTTVGEQGLTRPIITYMTWHKQLPIIVALDLMIGNSDRHCGNLCYDPETDTFFAIDMDDTFNKDLCILACAKIKMMLEDDKVIFTKKELKALQVMRDTLKFLVKKHKPQDLIRKLESFAVQAGFVEGSKIYSASIEKKLSLYRNTIIESHKSARKLIAFLDTIIVRKSRMITTMEAKEDVVP